MCVCKTVAQSCPGPAAQCHLRSKLALCASVSFSVTGKIVIFNLMELVALKNKQVRPRARYEVKAHRIFVTIINVIIVQIS